jgi:hypothetical protein
MFQISIVQEIKICILCSVTFFSKNRAVYEIMSTNMVEREAEDDKMAARYLLDW